MSDDKQKKIIKYIDWKFFELLDMASNWDIEKIGIDRGYATKEAEELKKYIRSIYAKAHDDGFQLGFEEGLNQQLGIDI